MTTYTVWNGTIPSGTSATTVARADGLQFKANSACTLTGIAFYIDASETGSLAGSGYTARLYSTTTGTTGTLIDTQVGTGTFVKGAWNWITFNDVLTAGTSYVAVVDNPSTLTFLHNYWSPAGSQGDITVGPITAPDETDALGGIQQPSGTTGGFPSNVNGSWYGIDVQVSVGSTTWNGAAALTGTGTLSPAGSKAVPGAAALNGTGTFTSAGAKTFHAAAALSGTGTMSSTPINGVPGAAALAGTGLAHAGALVGVPGAAVLGGAGVLHAIGTFAVPGFASFAARPVLTCSYLSAHIRIDTTTMFPGNQLGTYGADEAETTVIIPGVIDGTYT